MLWEIMFELMIELFKVMGEICQTFWNLAKELIKFFKDPKGKNRKGKTGSAGDAVTPEIAEAEAAEARKRGQLVMIFAIVGLVVATAFMFPGVRQAVFGTGGKLVRGNVLETPRNEFPMGEFTVAQLYKKMKMTLEDDYAVRTVYFYWHAPEVPPGKKVPLVVVLHGREGVSQAAIHLRKEAVQRQFPSFLLIPQSPPGKVWDAPQRYSGEEFKQAKEAKIPPESARSLRTAIMLLANMTDNPAIDMERLYIVGCGEGGDGVYGAAAHYPGVFAGGAALAAKWSYLDAPKMTKTPLLILHGGADKTVPPAFAANMEHFIRARGGRAGHHEFPGLGHDCDSPNFYAPGVWKWLFAQRRPAPPPAPAATPASANTRAR